MIGDREMINAIEARGGDFILGTDVPRHWANAMQVFVNSENAIIVFREQHVVSNNEQRDIVLKNISSVVVSTDTLRQAYQLIGAQLAVIDGNQGE